MKKLISIIVIFLIVLNLQLYPQSLKRWVIGSGGTSTQHSQATMNIGFTVGQTYVGLLKNSDLDTLHGVGYWYNAAYLSSIKIPVSMISIPSISGEIGNTVQIPILFKGSRFFNPEQIKNFEAVIRYNTTVLQPTGITPKSTLVSGDFAEVKISGTRIDTSSEIITEMDFLVRLGSVETTDLIIESFNWVESDIDTVLTSNGDLEVLGICREGDTTRLVKRTVPAEINAVSPNPAESFTVIEYSLSEKGYTKIELVDNLGSENYVLFEGVAEPGKNSMFVDLSDIPSGLYMVMMITPTERISKKILVNK